MSLVRQCEFIQLPLYPRCTQDATVCLEVTLPGRRKRKERYCGQHSGYRRTQYGQLRFKVKVISTKEKA